MTTTWSTTYVVEKCDVMWKLPLPVLTGGSERQLRKLTFGIDLSNYNVAPPHYGSIVREFLDTKFPQRWIGRGAVMAWPPRSPDIKSLDFYFWCYVKQHVYSERINDINHLKQRITDVFLSRTPDVLTRVWEELDYRLDVCKATNGAHIELR
ncbi:hypothetical protein AVEN_80191-1 [Araneus ventricosus]|uniref:Uncharacterized protein n=1 Tax=Araneus ventricosus TaxID=182803 RepID=A0A4Y2FG29_ARAVE|nr:hypothetical protein AVEN_80191-1 [Araneus ventricosus]